MFVLFQDIQSGLTHRGIACLLVGVVTVQQLKGAVGLAVGCTEGHVIASGDGTDPPVDLIT